MNRARFQPSFNRKPTFTCDCCGHLTRHTGQGTDNYCRPCEELLMLQNTLWDEGTEYLRAHDGWGEKTRDELLAMIVKRKGGADRVDRVKAYIGDLFDLDGYAAKRAAR